jgi:hypothetical protein
MIQKAEFLAFRERYSDPTLSVMTVLLALMIFVLAPIQATVGVMFLPLGVFMVVVMAVGLFVLAARWIVLIPIALAGLMHFALRLLREENDPIHPHIYLLASLWLTLAATFAVVVARAVYAQGRVTTHRIVGAILLYLLVALIFASLCLFIGAYFPGAFTNLVIADTPRLGADVIYFSLTTLTSVGYGDIVPVHPIARGLCNLESTIGQLYPAILLARLVSLHLAEAK